MSIVFLVFSKVCVNNECGRIDVFDGQDAGLLNMNLFCVAHELLRHHMYQFLLGRYIYIYIYTLIVM